MTSQFARRIYLPIVTQDDLDAAEELYEETYDFDGFLLEETEEDCHPWSQVVNEPDFGYW